MSGLRTVVCPDERATIAEGERLGATLRGGELLALEGDLGAGKTVFTRGVARGLGIPEAEVGSPSFVLAVEHRGGRLPLLHCDLYRLPASAGIDDLDIDDALAAGWVVIVEWGERLPEFLRGAAIRVIIARDPALGTEGRAITIVGPA